MVLLLGWQPLSQKILASRDKSKLVAEQDDSLPAVSGNTPSGRALSELEPPDASEPEPNAPASGADIPETVIQATRPVPMPPVDFDPQIYTLETDQAIFQFSNLNGGLHRVELKNHQREIRCDKSDDVDSNNRVILNDKNNFDILSIENLSILGASPGYESSIDLQARKVTFWKNLENGLQLAQEFTVQTNDFQVIARVQIKNLTADKPLKVPQLRRSIGSSVVTQAREMDTDLRLNFLIDEKFGKIDSLWFDNKIMGCIPGQPRFEFVEPSEKIRWAAMANQFFVTIVEPKEAVSGLVAVRKDVEFIRDGQPVPHKMIQGAFYYPERILAPGESLVQNFDIYSGPKSFTALNQLPASKHKNADFGFFGFFSKALLTAMHGLHSLGLPYALSILTITFIIKMLFWPLTHASTKSMKRMAKLQPQMKEIQEKFKDDPQKMQQKLMKFMKDNKVNPMGGCLPMFLQMPVFIGFFFMIRTAIELRGESFLWMCDLSQSDTVTTIFGGFPINPMPILMGITMLVQSRLTPPAAGMDPMQANMMRYMPLLFVGILYNYSSGLTMYWTFQNILSIAQTKLTRIDEEKLGQVVVSEDSPPETKKARRPKTWLEAKEMAMKSAKQKKKGK
ncbi:MAG: membrane protein insertase YidC [Verrucomicrobia bacterium]|nr:membrane protein insertase YidC [Verrucomicrobiota bacterium]